VYVLDIEEKRFKLMEVETALDTALEMYETRLGFKIKRVRGNGRCLHDSLCVNHLMLTHCFHVGTAIKHPVPDRVEASFVIFDIRVLLTLSPEHQSARMSKNYK